MNRQNEIKAVKYAIAATAIMSIIGTMGQIIPFIGILVYCAAILFFICAQKNGFVFTLPFIIAAYVFVAFGSSFSGAISDILGPGLSAMVMGELTHLNRNQGEVLGKGIMTAILCNLASIICIKLVDKKSILEELRKSLESSVQMYVDSGNLTIHAAQMMKQTYEVIFQIVPALLIAVSVLGAIFIYYMGCSFIRKKGGVIPKYFPFKAFSFSKNIILGSLLILIFGFIAGYTGIVNSDVLLMNISVIIGIIFCIQGLAVAIFLSDTIKFSRVVFIILLALLILSTIGLVIMFFIGVFDIVFNIRGRIAAKGKK